MPRSRPVSSFSSISSSGLSGVSRSRSLRETLRQKPAACIPVPPSLAHSPHLTSPHSVFRRAISNPILPTQEDEEWLRDTIPLSVSDGDGVKVTFNASRSVLSGMVVVVRRTADEDRDAGRGRSKEKENANRRRKEAESMSSPPLVRKRLPRNAVPVKTNWLQRTTSIAQAAIPYPRSNSDSAWSLHS
ncbi:hypothetical protein FIBSPDRAFT_861269 [Athelia psychrophila]|uniref:Uncharacterized protein n=1 Tax=Athelia psychrophila TaxID=1759441 RepID=A0A166JG95_9AGAM|nr:hypothetical protein FIBSPDRAFT_861269 [Fibularhizoctonia sp. CBS 109695]